MAAARERTFIMVKPDGVHRGLVGKIIKRFEAKGFKLVALKFTWVRNQYSRVKRLYSSFYNFSWHIDISWKNCNLINIRVPQVNEAYTIFYFSRQKNY
jgi:Nucleoside diphosphate kinase